MSVDTEAENAFYERRLKIQYCIGWLNGLERFSWYEEGEKYVGKCGRLYEDVRSEFLREQGVTEMALTMEAIDNEG